MSYQYKANPYLCNVKSREPDSGAYNLQSISALLLKGLVYETSVMLPMVRGSGTSTICTSHCQVLLGHSVNRCLILITMPNGAGLQN